VPSSKVGSSSWSVVLTWRSTGRSMMLDPGGTAVLQVHSPAVRAGQVSHAVDESGCLPVAVRNQQD